MVDEGSLFKSVFKSQSISLRQQHGHHFLFRNANLAAAKKKKTLKKRLRIRISDTAGPALVSLGRDEGNIYLSDFGK